MSHQVLLAIQNKSYVYLDMLLHKENINKGESISPLHFACLEGDKKCIKMCIEKGAIVDGKALDDYTRGYSNKIVRKSVVKLLIEHGADVNYVNKRKSIVNNLIPFIKKKSYMNIIMYIMSRDEYDIELIKSRLM